MADKGVVEALCAELQEGESELADALSGIVAPDAAESDVVGHIQRYADYLRRFANAAENLITVGGLDHLVVQNVYRSDFGDYWAMSLAP